MQSLSINIHDTDKGTLTSVTHDNGNRPTTVQYGSSSNQVAYAYDDLGRVSTRTLTVGGTGYASAYSFTTGGYGTGSTTALVSGITQTGQNLTYAYDNIGNITSEVRGSYITIYVYDNLGQLIRVNDQRAGETWTFTYDRGGNILSKSRYAYTTGTLGTALETIAYTYDVTWKDKLASYDGSAITYDNIGNPLSDGTWTYTWRAGRQLATMAATGTSASFDYNADGLRVRKTVNGSATDYTLHGKRIVHLKKGSDSLHFFYDAQGKPSEVDFNGTRYGYVHNLQGDVIAIIDGSGTQVVEYTYDSWGKSLTKAGTLSTTLGTLNPFRYRGYVYDEETGLYYLRSRYYNPDWGRFVNGDAKAHSKGCLLNVNVFCYCRNSPLQYSDYSGNDISIAIMEALFDYTTQNWNNPKVITTDVFLTNLSEFASKGHTYEKFMCAGYIAACLPYRQSATGATTIFTDYTVAMGYISDIGGKEGLMPGMLVGIYDENDNDGKPYNHIGVFTGTTVVNGQTKYWVYESTRSGGGPHLAEFDDQKWNVWGWHKAVVLSKKQLLEVFYNPLLWLVQDTK